MGICAKCKCSEHPIRHIYGHTRQHLICYGCLNGTPEKLMRSWVIQRELLMHLETVQELADILRSLENDYV